VNFLIKHFSSLCVTFFCFCPLVFFLSITKMLNFYSVFDMPHQAVHLPTTRHEIINKTGNLRLTTLRRVRATVVGVETQWELHNLSVCVFSLRYPACNEHVLHCHPWPNPLYNIFSHYLINGTIFEKEKLMNTKCVFWYFLQLLSETFLILRRNGRDMIKNVYLDICKVSFIHVRF
jgi:hypothetical protein